jgi:hypothetical protein
VCCQGANDASTCLPASPATCTGSKIECNEKTDCTGGDICCLKVTSETDFAITCQPGPKCPTGGLTSVQICTTNAECMGGSCSIYSCLGQITQSCTAPSVICTKM